MTPPKTVICPHCNNTLSKAPATHIALCPANPSLYAAYRAALEDPAWPGTLRAKLEYEAARGGLYSGTVLMRVWDCGWPALAARYGLVHAQQERKPIQWTRDTLPRIGKEIDAEIDRNRAITKVQEIGLPVLRYRDVQVGNVYQRIYQIR